MSLVCARCQEPAASLIEMRHTHYPIGLPSNGGEVRSIMVCGKCWQNTNKQRERSYERTMRRVRKMDR